MNKKNDINTQCVFMSERDTLAQIETHTCTHTHTRTHMGQSVNWVVWFKVKTIK